jgi:hypothetical protein
MGLSSDPEKRQRQLDNLKPNWPNGGQGGQRPKAAAKPPSAPPSKPRKAPPPTVEYPPDEPPKTPRSAPPSSPETPPPTTEPEHVEEPRRGGFLRGLLTGD